MPVLPSMIDSGDRSDLQDKCGVCWNTDDVFDQDEPDYAEIMNFHRELAKSTGGHWYLPFHETKSRMAFAEEMEAYKASGGMSVN
jgi:hypothetical protein